MTSPTLEPVHLDRLDFAVISGSASSGGLSMSTEDWFYGDDNLDRATNPGGAGPDLSVVVPGSGLPAELVSNPTGGDTYPTTGDPATDEAIRQTFTNLVEIRDAHGTGQTPAPGTFYTDAANQASIIQSDIQGVGRAAGSHWTGDSGDMYHTINQRLAT